MKTKAVKLKQNHILFEAQKDMAAICNPLDTFLNINYFHFRRTYKDGSYIILSTNSEWPLYFLEKNVAVKTPVSHEHFNSKCYISLWQGNIPDQTIADAKNYYKLHNAIAIIEKSENYFDSYSFATTKSNESTDIYINNVDALLKFSTYFQQQAINLIHSANKQIIRPPDYLKDLSINTILNMSVNSNNKVTVRAIPSF